MATPNRTPTARLIDTLQNKVGVAQDEAAIIEARLTELYNQRERLKGFIEGTQDAIGIVIEQSVVADES